MSPKIASCLEIGLRLKNLVRIAIVRKSGLDSSSLLAFVLLLFFFALLRGLEVRVVLDMAREVGKLVIRVFAQLVHVVLFF